MSHPQDYYSYQVYFIRHIPSDKFYVNVCQSKSYRMDQYILKEYRASKGKKYETIGKILDKDTENTSFTKLTTKYDTKDEADRKAYEIQLRLQAQGRLLNDILINPEKERCEGCGYMVRKQLMEAHKKDKCSQTQLNAINMFL